MQKRGKSAAGTQRWLCITCMSSYALGHETQKHDRLLGHFVEWLLGGRSQRELGVPDRTWRERVKWCWSIVPKMVLPTTSHLVLLLDGIRVGSLVCLIVRTPPYIVAWHWATYESSTSWDLLLRNIPQPAFVVCDGQKGVLLSIARCWPAAKVQRCHFHVWQNVRNKLTLNPQTDAGQALLSLTKTLLKGLSTWEEAEEWKSHFVAWEKEFGDFIRERTYQSVLLPRKRQWRYTHERLRSAFRQLVKLLKQEQLFTYLEGQITPPCIPRTTNYIEGGINSQLRTKLKIHRGMKEAHQCRLVDWYLYSRTENPKPPRYCR